MLLLLCVCRWQGRFLDAKTTLTDRDAKLEAVSEEVEKNLRLLGCTAIEDKLQVRGMGMEGVGVGVQAAGVGHEHLDWHGFS